MDKLQREYESLAKISYKKYQGKLNTIPMQLTQAGVSYTEAMELYFDDVYYLLYNLYCKNINELRYAIAELKYMQELERKYGSK